MTDDLHPNLHFVVQNLVHNLLKVMVYSNGIIMEFPIDQRPCIFKLFFRYITALHIIFEHLFTYRYRPLNNSVNESFALKLEIENIEMFAAHSIA